jgi:hypothetical protein
MSNKNTEKSKNGSKNPKVSSKPESNDSGITKIIGVLIVVFVVVFFVMRQGEHLGTRTDSTQQQTTIETEYSKTAISLVKEEINTKAKAKLVDLLNVYKEKKIEDTEGLLIAVESWEAVEAQDVEESNRYFDVSFTWKENDEPTVFQWRVDLKNQAVTPVNEPALAFAAFVDQLALPEEPEETTEDSDEPTGEDVAIEDMPIDILPPPEAVPPPTGLDPGSVVVPHDISISDPLPIPPMTFHDEPPFELVGTMKSGGQYQAMIQQNGRALKLSFKKVTHAD